MPKTKTKPIKENVKQIKDLGKASETNVTENKKEKTKVIPKRIELNAFKLFGRSFLNLWDHWPQFSVIYLIYVVISFVLVRGVSLNTNESQLKAVVGGLSRSTSAQASAVTNAFSLFINSSGNTTSPSAGTYQLFILLIFSLVIIWALRMVSSGKKLRVSDAFYKSLYPLIPILLVVLLIGIELIPLLLGAYVYSVVLTDKLFNNLFEEIGLIVVCVGMALVSLYFITSSIFALYIVTLPDMRPMIALRSAKRLVKSRRLIVMRKVLFLPLALIVIGGVIVIPSTILSTLAGEIIFFLYISLCLFVSHSYLYTLYREML